MAYRVLPFAVTIPAGTTEAAPVTVPLAMDNWELESMDLEVPSGPNGLMGFQVYNNGVAWLPYGPGEWIVWNNYGQNYPLQDQPNASGWAIVGYNLGSYPHTVTVRFHVNPVDTTALQAPAPAVNIITTPAPSTATVVL